MIRIENLQVYGFESAMRGLRNPMNSWSLNDTIGNKIGDNDLTLLKRLCKVGSDHRKALRQMFISCDITAPLYWWKEFDTYKVGVTSNSQSTMHKLCSRALGVHDFSFDDMHDNECIVHEVIDNLNARIADYQITKNKNLWRTIIQLLPCAYNQTRTITMNYENVLNMYSQRKYHKLSEWREFCYWMYYHLPYFKVLVDELENK